MAGRPWLAVEDHAPRPVARDGSGDLAVEYGTFATTVKDKKGKPSAVNEKYIVAWKKQADGKWKAIGDIWNGDK